MGVRKNEDGDFTVQGTDGVTSASQAELDFGSDHYDRITAEEYECLRLKSDVVSADIEIDSWSCSDTDHNYLCFFENAGNRSLLYRISYISFLLNF